MTADPPSELYRNAAGDELVFIHTGRAVFESVFGRIEAGPGDYVVIPQSTTHRWVIDEQDDAGPGPRPRGGGPHRPPGALPHPDRAAARRRPVQRARPPPAEAPLVVEDEQVRVLIRSRARVDASTSTSTTPSTSSAGTAAPTRSPSRSTTSSRSSAASTNRRRSTRPSPAPASSSAASSPAYYDFDPAAIKVPYHHANVDSDEVLYYVEGDFMSRKGAGIGVGSITLHPAGFVHGPQPGSVEASMDADPDRGDGGDDRHLRAAARQRRRPLGRRPAYEKSWVSPRYLKHPICTSQLSFREFSGTNATLVSECEELPEGDGRRAPDRGRRPGERSRQFRPTIDAAPAAPPTPAGWVPTGGRVRLEGRSRPAEGPLVGVRPAS